MTATVCLHALALYRSRIDFARRSAERSERMELSAGPRNRESADALSRASHADSRAGRLPP
jgi:hypothetical protein